MFANLISKLRLISLAPKIEQEKEYSLAAFLHKKIGGTLVINQSLNHPKHYDEAFSLKNPSDKTYGEIGSFINIFLRSKGFSCQEEYCWPTSPYYVGIFKSHCVNNESRRVVARYTEKNDLIVRIYPYNRFTDRILSKTPKDYNEDSIGVSPLAGD